MCTLYQVMYALTSFREWPVPDSESPHTYKAGMCCQYRGMTITHRNRLKNFLYIFVIVSIYPGLQFKHYSLVSHNAPACNFDIAEKITDSFSIRTNIWQLLSDSVCQPLPLGGPVPIICKMEAVLEAFSQLGQLDLLYTIHSDSNTFFYVVEILYQ